MKLRLHQLIEVEVIELLESGSCIVNIDGSLLRVQPQLNSKPQPGDQLRVKVVALKPLKFKAVRGHSMGIDVEV